jgi:hypothetical protein
MVCSDMLCRRFAAGSDQTTAPLGKPNGKVLLSLRDERSQAQTHPQQTPNKPIPNKPIKPNKPIPTNPSPTSPNPCPRGPSQTSPRKTLNVTSQRTRPLPRSGNSTLPWAAGPRQGRTSPQIAAKRRQGCARKSSAIRMVQTLSCTRAPHAFPNYRESLSDASRRVQHHFRRRPRS